LFKRHLVLGFFGLCTLVRAEILPAIAIVLVFDGQMPLGAKSCTPIHRRSRTGSYVDSDQFYRLVTYTYGKRLAQPISIHIFILTNSKATIRFDERTQPPHAEVIIEQIAMQNRPFRVFDGGGGELGSPSDIYLLRCIKRRGCWHGEYW